MDNAEKNLKENFDWIVTDNLKLDNPLRYAIKWLKKAKQETDINNKIVQLSLVLEYSINTDRNDITKDLKEKSAILFTYEHKNNYKSAKNKIYDFYNLRCKIVHGDDEINSSDETEKLILDAETIIRENLLLLCKLNQSYSFEKIDNYIEDVRKQTPRPTLKSIIEK